MSFRLLQRIFSYRNIKSIFWSQNHRRGIHTVRENHHQTQNVQNFNIINLAHDAKVNNNNNQFIRFSRRLFVDNVLNRVTNPVSSALRVEATKKFAFGDSLPFLSLVGCSLASGNGVLTKEDEMEGICWEIREAVSRYQSRLTQKIIDNEVSESLSLEDFEIGPPIAKGCNAVVYAAAFKNYHAKDLAEVVDQPSTSHDFQPATCEMNLPKFIHNYTGSIDNLQEIAASPRDSFVALRNFENSPINLDLMTSIKFSERVDVRTQSRYSSMSEESDSSHEASSDDANIFHYPWALKMMFNYDIQSNAMAILRAMYKETVPARSRFDSTNVENWEKVIMDQTVNLPAHPNIVLMPAYFCDQIPHLRQSHALFPSALPARLNPNGYGRNMSLFLLMKRYDYNLRDFLKSDVDMRTRIILFAQLLEAVAHINRFGIAHRDLKSDNILIDTTSDSVPLLVLSDFGCCLADKTNGLRLPYLTHEMEKGGNQALMAPEIINKEPNMFAVLNYSKSDLWSCGAIAYEIFGYENPFYNSSKAKFGVSPLTNQNYSESMLPQMGDDVPLIVRKLVENILQKSPSKRLSCDVAANVLELYLWAPSSWVRYGRNPTNSEILEWLLSLTTKVLCESGLNNLNPEFLKKNRRTYTEYILISTFLTRAKLRNIRQALNWIQSL